MSNYCPACMSIPCKCSTEPEFHQIRVPVDSEYHDHITQMREHEQAAVSALLNGGTL